MASDILFIVTTSLELSVCPQCSCKKQHLVCLQLVNVCLIVMLINVEYEYLFVLTLNVYQTVLTNHAQNASQEIQINCEGDHICF